MGIQAVRVYELDDGLPGARWLVDRMWPRGIAKAALKLAGWARDAAPSAELRRWFGHDPDRWSEFCRRYANELNAAPATWAPLRDAAYAGDLLLLYAARDTQFNNAVALRNYLNRRLAAPAGPPREELGGESVCWLHRVCPICGHLAEDRLARSCPRCGADLAD